MQINSNTNHQLNYLYHNKSMHEKAVQAVQQPAQFNQNQDRYLQENRVSHSTMIDLLLSPFGRGFLSFTT